MTFTTIGWDDGRVRLIDQTRLPADEIYRLCETPADVADAIRTMQIRGAPAIGIAAAMGMALAARLAHGGPAEVAAAVDESGDVLAGTRPTAVNLFWAIERMRRVTRAALAARADVEALRERLVAEASAVLADDIAANRAMGAHGADLLPQKCVVLTHCNAGALATGGYGTALGVVRAAVEAGKEIKVFADETRPFLQGARLTVWELQKDGIDVTLLCDNMAGWLMQQGEVDAVIVGTDRTVANGDVANKIGTYSLAVLARENGIPFYVAAPTSTVDLKTRTGEDIVIEERDPSEVTVLAGVPIAPPGTKARHPAFDVTPNRYVTAIITEKGVARPPYRDSLVRLLEQD
jgi:methylthioribose-1-phosphate isomerase